MRCLFGCRRPASHADTPLDDQQAMQGLHQTAQYCSMMRSVIKIQVCSMMRYCSMMLDDAQYFTILLQPGLASQPAFQQSGTL